MTTLTEFQQDLREGMTINDALIKHELTFKQACDTLHGYRIRRKKQPNNHCDSFTKEKYITYNRKKYLVRKNTNGKERYYGRYTTLEEAVIVRDYLEEHGWTKHNLKVIKERLGE